MSTNATQPKPVSVQGDNSATVQHAYKWSEVGVIPEEWEVKRLSDISTVVRGGSPRPAGDPRYFDGDFIPWLTVAALTNIPDSVLCVTEAVGCLTEEGARHSRTLEKDTLIIANSGATLGVAKILGIRCCANDGIAALINQREGDKRFICQYLNSLTKHLREVVATGLGQPNLNTRLIGDIRIPVPPPDEQGIIAGVLSDVDSLIGALDKLIAKKRAIKQAAMQQLLTGRTRLPGFEGEWATRRIGDVVSFLSTANNPRSDLSSYGSVQYIHYGDVHAHGAPILDCRASDLPMIDEGKVGNIACLEDGDLVLADASEDLQGVGKSVEIKNATDRQVVSGLHTLLCRGDKRHWANGFKAYLQFIPAFKKALERVATGISVYGITKSHVAEVELPLPPVPEQEAIVTVLSDMDDEITALECRRDKTKEIKLGMRQALLTGRVRLVKPGARA